MRIQELLLEYDRSKTIQRYGDKIFAKITGDNNSNQSSVQQRATQLEKVFERLESMDPTPNKKHVQWIAREFAAGTFRLEDGPRIHSALEDFGTYQRRLAVKDINQYSLHQLEDAIDQLKSGTSDTVSNSKFDQELPPQSQEVEYDLLYNGPLGWLACPNTEAASQLLGRGTKWCTAWTNRPSMFDSYHNDGPLYIWRDANGKKYQFFFPHTRGEFQFMDSSDRPIEPELLENFRTRHPVMKKIFAEQEEIISNLPAPAFRYAHEVLMAPFPPGEKAIARDAEFALKYAREVLKGPFPLGEEAIAGKTEYAFSYAKNVLKGPFPQGEKAVSLIPQTAYQYASEVLKGPFPQGEPAIARNLTLAYQYAQDVLEGPFERAEDNIAKFSPGLACQYAVNVIGRRWIPGEETIARDAFFSYRYSVNALHRRRFPPGEKAIAKNSKYAYLYAQEVIRGPWPPGEQAIASDHDWKSHYERHILKGRPWSFEDSNN